jgi:uncharacterized DUF497 family protein
MLLGHCRHGRPARPANSYLGFAAEAAPTINSIRFVKRLAIYIIVCIIQTMNFTWRESKRKTNLKKHGLDFADAEKVFVGPMAVFEDTSRDYGEQRWVGIGLLNFLVVLIVHVEFDGTIHIISMRKADSDETNLFYQTYF